MAYHRKHHHRRHRKNPFGMDSSVVKDAVYVAAGAVGASALPGMILPSMASGWSGVLATALSAVGLSFAGRMVGGPAGGAEVLKGGLAVTVIKALGAAGVSVPGLGLYAPSWFAVPTASSQYLQSANGNQPGFNRGGGTIIFPGPGGQPIAVPASSPAGKAATAAAANAAKGVSGLGYHRFRSRYAGGYGG